MLHKNAWNFIPFCRYPFKGDNCVCQHIKYKVYKKKHYFHFQNILQVFQIYMWKKSASLLADLQQIAGKIHFLILSGNYSSASKNTIHCGSFIRHLLIEINITKHFKITVKVRKSCNLKDKYELKNCYQTKWSHYSSRHYNHCDNFQYLEMTRW